MHVYAYSFLRAEVVRARVYVLCVHIIIQKLIPYLIRYYRKGNLNRK